MAMKKQHDAKACYHWDTPPRQCRQSLGYLVGIWTTEYRKQFFDAAALAAPPVTAPAATTPAVALALAAAPVKAALTAAPVTAPAATFPAAAPPMMTPLAGDSEEEEKQRVFLETWKQVPGDDGRPTQLPNIIDAAFPLTRPDWNFNTPEEAHLQALQLVQREVWKPLAKAYQEQLDKPVVPHPFQIGDSVWVRRHQTKSLESRWKGPYTVLLTIPTALKVDGIAAWIHASHVKAAREPDPAGSRKSTWTVRHTRNPLKIRLTRGSSSSPSS
ncbi:uncharacterized protein LOC143267490 [Peromyscus maniculatus bairdii]|uniref:uncharacterized protein LOC143267490 n=1 Tax=Peromyscus maniculatus bairdii TaxID=230844 RepID=UPI003FCFA82D